MLEHVNEASTFCHEPNDGGPVSYDTPYANDNHWCNNGQFGRSPSNGSCLDATGNTLGNAKLAVIIDIKFSILLSIKAKLLYLTSPESLLLREITWGLDILGNPLPSHKCLREAVLNNTLQLKLLQYRRQWPKHSNRYL